jgi:hypothetical protein
MGVGYGMQTRNLHQEADRSHGNGWGWRKGSVDVDDEHFELLYGSGDSDPATWVLVARIGRPLGKVFPVKFTASGAEGVKAAVAQLNFYLVEKGETNPWGTRNIIAARAPTGIPRFIGRFSRAAADRDSPAAHWRKDSVELFRVSREIGIRR